MMSSFIILEKDWRRKKMKINNEKKYIDPLVTAIAIAKKDLIINIRYPLEVIFWAVVPVLWILPHIFSGIALSGGYQNQILASAVGSGDFIQFIAIGSITYTYAAATIWGMANALRWEQYSGTLESLYLAPVSRFSILMGGTISQAVISTIQVIIQFAIFAILFGIWYPLPAFIPVVFIVVLMIVAFQGFAFMLAAVIMFFKDPDVLNDFISTLINIVSPVSYPLNAVPLSLRIISLLIPLTYALIGIRLILMQLSELFTLEQITLALLLLSVLFWLIGYSLFLFAERKTKKKGSLGGY